MNEEISVQLIRFRLIQRLAEIKHLAPEDVDITKTYNSYGLNSLEIVSLAWDLEECLSRPLDVNLLWDYPTIESLTNFLASEHLK